MNNSIRVGTFWLHIRNYEDRARCPLCPDTIETLDHILFQCTSPERTTIWDLAQRLWPQEFGPWHPPTFGTILGCGSVAAPHTDLPQPNPRALGKARFHRILLSESAHLIWTLRCARVISEQTHTPQSITTLWMSKIDTRLSLDRTLAKHPRRTALRSRSHHTWTPVLSPHLTLPPNWVTMPEVLVGITLPRPSEPTEVT